MTVETTPRVTSGMPCVFVLAIGMFALGLDAYILAALLPGIGTSFHVTVSDAGLAVTGFTLAYGLLSPILAAVSASLDRRVILVGSLSLFALANVGSMLASGFGVLMLTRILAGAAAGLYAPSAAATAVRLVSGELRGRALAVVLGGLTAATALGVPIGVFVANHFGWRTALLLVVGVSALAVIGTALGLPSVKTPTPGLRERFALLTDRMVLGRITVMLLAATANLGLYTYLAVLLSEDLAIDRGSLPGYFLLWGVAGAAGNGISGWLLDRGFSAATILTVCLTTTMVAIGAFPLLGHAKAGVAVILIVWGATTWSLQVPLQHQLTRIAPENTATAIALLASGVYLGSAIGSALGGIVLSVSADLLGPAAAFFVFLALLLHLLTSPRSAAVP